MNLYEHTHTYLNSTFCVILTKLLTPFSQNKNFATKTLLQSVTYMYVHKLSLCSCAEQIKL